MSIRPGKSGSAMQKRSDDIERYLAQPNLAVLATIGPGDRAHAMPMWYLYENGSFVMSTARGSQKHRNIERHSRATVLVNTQEVPYYAVMVQCKAETGPPLSPDSRLRMAVRYLGEGPAHEYVSQRLATDSVTIVLQQENIV